jgi:hypothetical protein
LFRAACARSRQGKIVEQARQTFQNGYTRRPPERFGELEAVASASFNEAAVVSGHELVRVRRDQTEGGIRVVVHHAIPDRLP